MEPHCIPYCKPLEYVFKDAASHPVVSVVAISNGSPIARETMLTLKVGRRSEARRGVDCVPISGNRQFEDEA